MRCKEDNVVEVWCVMLDRGGAVSWGTEGKAISLLCGKELDKSDTNFCPHVLSRPPKNSE